MLRSDRSGSGAPTLLLLPGLLCTQRLWDRARPLLEAFHDVLTVDLPGVGGGDLPEGAADLEAYADRVCEVLDELVHRRLALRRVVPLDVDPADRVAEHALDERDPALPALALLRLAGQARVVDPPGAGDDAVRAAREAIALNEAVFG